MAKAPDLRGLCFLDGASPVALRQHRTDAAVAANETDTARGDASTYWVCLALLLAMVTLAMRIASMW